MYTVCTVNKYDSNMFNILYIQSTNKYYILYIDFSKSFRPTFPSSMEPNKIAPSSILNSQTIFWIMT